MQNQSLPPVIDAHVDLLYDLLRHHPETSLTDLPADAWVNLPKLRAGGVRVFVSAFYCEDANNGPAKAAQNLRFLLEYAERNLGGVKTAKTAADLEAAYRGSGPPIALRLLENSDALMEYPPEALRRSGFRMVGLTHAGRNRIGDGNAVPHPTGLTPAGRSLAKELDRLGFAIDTAHLSKPCFMEVADSFEGPILSTHTGIRAFCDTPRNLDDEQIRIILDRGGVIGLAAFPGMLSADGHAGIMDLVGQIDWMVQKYGPGSIALGSDFGGYDSVCEGLEDHAGFPRLANLLSEAGLTDQTIEGILGGNWYRFFSTLLAK